MQCVRARCPSNSAVATLPTLVVCARPRRRRPRAACAALDAALGAGAQGGALREAPNRSAADGPPGALCTLAVTADGPSLEEALGGAFDGP